MRRSAGLRQPPWARAVAGCHGRKLYNCAGTPLGAAGRALADLTRAGELVNPRDKRGYQMPDWPRGPRTKSLF